MEKIVQSRTVIVAGAQYRKPDLPGIWRNLKELGVSTYGARVSNARLCRNENIAIVRRRKFQPASRRFPCCTLNTCI